MEGVTETKFGTMVA